MSQSTMAPGPLHIMTAFPEPEREPVREQAPHLCIVSIYAGSRRVVQERRGSVGCGVDAVIGQ
jgi:hypothetical protein